MRTTEKPRTRFRQDLKREFKGPHRRTLQEDLDEVLKLLLLDQQLPDKYNDHPLKGEWSDHRDCHVKPNLVLIYQKEGDILRLVRLGSHSLLGLTT